MGPRVRFAPSPSGYLHIGGARTALFSWLWAKKTEGRFILRVEDTDSERSSPRSVEAQLSALRWLGLDWDEGPEVGGPHAPYFQSERRHYYHQACDRLLNSGHAYRCYCTKEDLDRARAELKMRDPKAQFVYPGTCRERRDEPDLPHVVRFKSPHTGSTDFTDKVFGRISTPNSQLQDFVVLRGNGVPLYNLAAVVDDHRMQISLVARGREHIGNTPQQLLLYEALGYSPPEFAHLPLILSPRGEKLSKRHAAVSVQDYRDRGYTPMGVLNYLVRFGWSHGDREIFSRSELIQAFDWDRVKKSDGKFDDKKFADVAFEHLKRPELTSDEEYLRQVQPFLKKRGIEQPPAQTLAQALPLIRERAKNLEDAAYHLDFYVREPPEVDEKAKAKFLTREACAQLKRLLDALAGAPDWTAQVLEQCVNNLVQTQHLPLKQVAQPLRVALTGRSASPPLFDVMQVLGRQTSLMRIERAVELSS